MYTLIFFKFKKIIKNYIILKKHLDKAVFFNKKAQVLEVGYKEGNINSFSSSKNKCK